MELQDVLDPFTWILLCGVLGLVAYFFLTPMADRTDAMIAKEAMAKDTEWDEAVRLLDNDRR